MIRVHQKFMLLIKYARNSVNTVGVGEFDGLGVGVGLKK